jgi:hypothetical protein
MAIRRKRTGGVGVVLPWEKRRSRLAWLSRRNARRAVGACALALVALGLLRVEQRRRAVHATRAAIGNVIHAVDAYRADHEGHCPAGGVAELVTPGDGHEAYLSRVPRDGWGNALRVTCPGRKHPSSADVVSAGPTGSFEDTDQIE